MLPCMAYHPSHFVGEVLLHPVYWVATTGDHVPDQLQVGSHHYHSVLSRWS